MKTEILVIATASLNNEVENVDLKSEDVNLEEIIDEFAQQCDTRGVSRELQSGMEEDKREV